MRAFVAEKPNLLLHYWSMCLKFQLKLKGGIGRWKGVRKQCCGCNRYRGKLWKKQFAVPARGIQKVTHFSPGQPMTLALESLKTQDHICYAYTSRRHAYKTHGRAHKSLRIQRQFEQRTKGKYAQLQRSSQAKGSMHASIVWPPLQRKNSINATHLHSLYTCCCANADRLFLSEIAQHWIKEPFCKYPASSYYASVEFSPKVSTWHDSILKVFVLQLLPS